MNWTALEGEYPAPSWPPVDQTTGETIDILVVIDGMHFIARYSHARREWTSSGLYSSERRDRPSHWMQLPALPEV